MAWLFQQKGSSVWWVGYRVDGQVKRCSTGLREEAAAEVEKGKIEALAAAKKSGVNLEDAFEALSGKSVPRVTLVEQMNLWLSETKRTVANATQVKYEATGARLIEFLKATDKGPLLADITQAQLDEYLDGRTKTVSASTTNLERTILRIFFKRAKDTGILKVNPIVHIERFKVVRKKNRKIFTIDDLTRIYEAAPSPFWRYMIIGGAYTGMRMGDLITLRIEEVDMATHWIRREMGKVQGRFVHVPMVPILTDLIRQQILERAAGFIWPKEAAKYQKHGAGQFSNAFTAILANAGLVEKRSHQSRNIGRDAKRDRGDGASFHGFRHFFITELKRTGANASVAKALAGHSNDAINELYTHMPTETLAQAVNQLPRFVKEVE